ncbi:YheT family hydrolase [Balneola sp. MJW-20]|uniref:YheT family hydrolase n=1 Tax=Gracilimonas aurantiaca TaxID=3234185 RepID=UPI0039099FED
MSSLSEHKISTFNGFKTKWWALNGHIHTVVASQFSTIKDVDCSRVTISTPDSDFLEADLNILNNDQPIVALFHGLEGSSRRYYIRNLMWELEKMGVSSAAMNFRGCGDELNNQPRFYHSGATDDYRVFFEYLSREFPGRPIYAIGFSLGANALIKYLGEEEGQSVVMKAAAVSPPYDLREGSLQLQEGINHLYEVYFLRSLVDKLRRKKQQYPDLPDFKGSTLYDFDDTVTAPLHGFKDADHYYETCSSKHFYGSIKTPTLIIHSKDDSLCPIAYAPETKILENPFTEHLVTETGGHMGFLSSPDGWLNRTLLYWLGFTNTEHTQKN